MSPISPSHAGCVNCLSELFILGLAKTVLVLHKLSELPWRNFYQNILDLPISLPVSDNLSLASLSTTIAPNLSEAFA
ncbi:hypothetical protein [Okeania hirsuta]|uniref:hypothetical protein n=1 Tax=Okeania TaxID=1458928 RepID=UPI00195F9A60